LESPGFACTGKDEPPQAGLQQLTRHLQADYRVRLSQTEPVFCRFLPGERNNRRLDTNNQDNRNRLVRQMRAQVPGPDYYLNGPYAKYMEQVVTVGSLTVRQGRWPSGHFPDPPLDDFNLQLAIEARGSSFTGDFGSGRFTHKFRQGEFHLAPSGVACDYLSEGPVTVMALHLNQSLLDDMAGEEVPLRDFGALHGRPFRNGLAEAAMWRLWRESLAPNHASACLAESARMAIVAALLSDCLGRDRFERKMAGSALSADRLRMAMDYADANRDMPLRLKDWAAQLGMSPFRFARAFKAAAGIAPHQYLLRERARHAHRLVAETALPLSEIALASGFSNQAHMTRLFTKMFGQAPGAVRRTHNGRPT
jgi:AraC family transcriptional regulator